MRRETSAARVGYSAWRLIWIVLVLVFGAVGFASNGLILSHLYFDPGGAGDMGARLSRDDAPLAGTVVVHDLEPRSALRAAGVREGDHLRLAHPWDDLRMIPAGERIEFDDLSRPGRPHLSAVLPAVPPAPADSRLLQAMTFIGNSLMTFMGLMIFWRGRREVGTMLLGTAFVLIGPMPPFFWPAPAWQIPVWTAPMLVGIAALPWTFLRFAMGFYEQHTTRIGRGERTAFWLLVALQAVTCVLEMADTLWNLRLPGMEVIRPLNYSLQALGLVIPVWYLARGWMRSAAELRRRYAVMLIALPISFFPQCIYVLASAFLFFKLDFSSPIIVTASFGFIFGPMLFAYAVFRHRLLDLGFALNRALIYGVVSAILLGAFGLLEWAFDHFVHIEGREKNALIDAGIALAVFLTFHRVRDLVEHNIERLFYRRWRENEAALKRFAAEAGYITRPAALAKAFVEELKRFSGGADCGVYWLGGAGFRRAAGDGPASAATDDPGLVALRARLKPVLSEDAGSALGGVLLLPMAHRSEVQGFVLLGAKPDGDGYRPDEVEALAHAARHVGTDLHALDIERLERETDDLRRQNAALAAQVQLARDLGAVRSMP